MKVFFLMLVLAGMGCAQDSFLETGVPDVLDGHVYDPGRWLIEDRRQEIERTLQEAEDRWEVKLYAVVLEQEPVVGAESFALKLGRRWGGSGVWGVVIHVPGAENSPWCVAERGELADWGDKSVFDEAVQRAVQRARRETEERLRLQVACRELTDELGFLGVTIQRRSEALSKFRSDGLTKAQNHWKLRKFFRPALMVGGPLLLLLGFLFVLAMKRRWSRRKTEFIFPETEYRYRFQGPWSGGGNVMLRFTSKVGEDGSRRG
ncbi:MAG: hypothetical protein ACSHYF_09005 [Verrucomicrobiaceae bacterium]